MVSFYFFPSEITTVYRLYNHELVGNSGDDKTNYIINVIT